MEQEIQEFIKALSEYIRTTMPIGEDADYCHDTVQIIDARNGLFRSAGIQSTDEQHNIYTLRSLCRLDEDTFEYIPDEGKLRSLARSFF